MILITGATGHIGAAVIQQLLTKLPASQIAALVRDEAKATHLQAQGVSLRVGDYRDPAALDRAMQGVEKVLLVSGGGEADGLQLHQNVVDAARRAGVRCLAYTGRALHDRHTLTNELMKRHFLTEDYIQASGLDYVLFRNILYMDTLPQFVGPKVLETGIHLPAGEGRVSFALRREMGEAIANVLAEGDCANRIYTFTNSDAYSFHDVAAALTELSGREVRYTDIEPAAFVAGMQARGLPEFVVNLTLGFMTDIKNGQESAVTSELAEALGRQPVSLKEGLRELMGL
ncbi:SDR family oxidoreductase [Hymenobacter jeollabukensis]|uniref:SDR family oxidoreductase n=1 Tax=Hymenobacter jeollabukensis TaxID=2025313 RepID=A0A5R8WNW7_9BACT|nr:SDR family oxidoreductase [Hymenobacter jeollabukensis]TLM91758.1 SDR family oxidoreductase [Hymenobacter jeollabukensis]